MADLVAEIGNALRANTVDVDLLIPYDRGDVLASVHRIGEVTSQEHAGEGVALKAGIPAADLYHFSEWISPDKEA